MKLGLCTAPQNIETAAQLGFDYIECSVTSIAAMEQSEFDALLAKKPTFPIPILKCNGFLPGDVKPVGPSVSEEALDAYLEKALSRVSALGVKVVVFGSGGARAVPEGFSHVTAWRQIVDFLRFLIPYCEKYDIRIALEPLRRKECNILNLVSEGTLLSAIVDHPRIGVLGDSFHMITSGEPWDAFKYAGEKLLHVHISHSLPDLSGRIYPAPDDGEDYASMLNTLKEMGYQGDVSIEAGCKDLAVEGAAAIACLRPLM